MNKREGKEDTPVDNINEAITALEGAKAVRTLTNTKTQAMIKAIMALEKAKAQLETKQQAPIDNPSHLLAMAAKKKNVDVDYKEFVDTKRNKMKMIVMENDFSKSCSTAKLAKKTRKEKMTSIEGMWVDIYELLDEITNASHELHILDELVTKLEIVELHEGRERTKSKAKPSAKSLVKTPVKNTKPSAKPSAKPSTNVKHTKQSSSKKQSKSTPVSDDESKQQEQSDEPEDQQSEDQQSEDQQSEEPQSDAHSEEGEQKDSGGEPDDQGKHP